MLIGHTNDVKFRVNVMGTSAEATARVILCTYPQLIFPAAKVGDQWGAQIKVPETVKPGTYEMKVEVMVGNRHFVPLTKNVDLEGPHVEEAKEVVPVKPVVLPIKPAVDPMKTSVLLRAVTAAGAKDASVVPTVPMLSNPVAPMLPVDCAPPVDKPKAKKIELPKDFFKFEPKKVEPVKINIKPISSKLTHTVIDKPLAKEAVQPVLEINHGTPIRLIKGEIIYE